jgi:probable F420-dependent oxidoreductase
MKFGVYLIESANGVAPRAESLASPSYLGEVARRAEEVGFDSIWIPDHVVMPVRYASRYPYQDYEGDEFKRYPWDEAGFPEPLTALTFVAAVTSRVELCTGVMILPERNPLFLAKQAATLDRLSDGRLRLGVGIGWLREEFEAMGIPWERRGTRAEEAVAAMRALWAEDQATYHGDTVSFDRVRCLPRPVNGAIPILVGGHSEPAARRAGRIGDGYIPIIGSGDSFQDETRRLVGVMREEAERCGRDPSAIEVAGFGSEDVDVLHAMQEAGFDHLFCFVCEPTVEAGKARVDELAASVLAPFGG